MRKYLLLATAAGCMVSTCAFAGGSIATNKQSAVINVKADIQIANELKSLQDMNFGTLYILSGTTGDLASLSAEDGSIYVMNPGVVATRGTPMVGSIDANNNKNMQLANAHITCADGTGDPRNGSCSLGNGLALKNLDVWGGYMEPMSFGGVLTATEAITQAKNIDAAGIRVELQY